MIVIMAVIRYNFIIEIAQRQETGRKVMDERL